MIRTEMGAIAIMAAHPARHCGRYPQHLMQAIPHLVQLMHANMAQPWVQPVFATALKKRLQCRKTLPVQHIARRIIGVTMRAS